MPDGPANNTDREIWRRTPDDFYSPSIHVTAEGGIGMNVGGRVVVMDIEDWHRLAWQDDAGPTERKDRIVTANRE